MTRKKVKLAFITNDSSRKATFKKRKKGLMKKVNELSTLCGITACAIIYSPYDTNPEVWPSNSGVQRVISEFRTLPEMDQHKKMVDQETFLTQRVGKALEQLKKQRKDNREMEMTEVMFQCLVGNMGLFNLNLIDLNDLGYLIEQYLKDINRRIEILGGNNNNNNNNNYRLEIGESSNATSDEHKGGIGSLAVVAATTAPNAAAAIREVGSSSVAATSMFNPNNQQQFRYYEQQQQQQQVLPLDLNMRQADQNQQQQQQQWFMEMMNNPEQMNYAAEQIGFPFMDHNHRYNMHHHHHQQQQQQEEEEEQNSGDSATTAVTAVAASSSSTVPVTSSNLTNTLWFR